jgi:xanthine dehydrogenase accessory factor
MRDESGLEAALGSGARYIAFIASERKATKLRAYLKERGHDPRQVDAILSPAGVEIGAVTPEEIALSVLADVVRARRRGGSSVGVPVPESASPGHLASVDSEILNPPVAQTSGKGNAIDPICGMSVAIATAEYRSEYQGTTYFFCCAGCQHRFDKEPARYLTGAGASV